MPRPTKKIIFILIGLFLIFALFALWQKIKPQPPEVLSTVPAHQSRDVGLDTPIEFVFDKPAKINDLKIQAQPEFLHHASLENEKLTLKPEGSLNYDTQYTVSLSYLPTNSLISQISFQTIAPQGSSEAVELIQKAQQEKYPLAPFTPPDDSHFYFRYTGPKQLKVYSSLDLAATQKNFTSWVTSLNLDLSDHEIIWVE